MLKLCSQQWSSITIYKNTVLVIVLATKMFHNLLQKVDVFHFPWHTYGQERLKRRNTLGCLDQYAAQNSKYARPPIPS